MKRKTFNITLLILCLIQIFQVVNPVKFAEAAAAIRKLGPVNLSGLTSDPTGNAGDVYFNTSSNKFRQYDGSTWTNIGSGGGGGSGGINFVGLDSSFAAVNTNDVDAETTTGNWATYNDSAAIPVDMTGGSATHLTLSRTTTAGQVLNGSGSFKIIKTANNAQGEGVSVIANVPPGYPGQQQSIILPFHIISGSLVSGDLLLYVYDVTNSQIITPSNNDIFSTSVTAASFTLPSTCTQIRVGFHFASTSATAVTFSFDDVKVGPNNITYGPAMTDWKSDLTFTASSGFGTVTNNNVYYKRVGDSMHIRGQWSNGTVAASTGYIQLPSGFTIDSTKFSTNKYQNVGVGNQVNISGSATNLYTSDNGIVLFIDNVTPVSNQIFFAFRSISANYEKVNVNSWSNTSDTITFDFSVPIIGWSTNIVSSTDKVIQISNYLANGTRVTGSAPTALGQYRSYLRNANANTYTETNGAPGTAPTTSDGIVLYQATTWANSDASNNPTKYDIFVGVNKNVTFNFYRNAGRTGQIDVTPGIYNNNTLTGWEHSYDPTTGIATFNATAGNLSTSSPQAGTDTNGAFVAATIYGDITVSDNAFTVQSIPHVMTDSPSVTNIFYGQATVSGCTMAQSSNSLVTCTKDATGLFHVNFPTGMFSATPVCTCTIYVSHNTDFNEACDVDAVTTATATTVYFVTSDSSPIKADRVANIQCMGPH